MKSINKKILKSSNGITLIALVITIIMLLILAGISISMLAGDNGILQHATDSKEKTTVAGEKEQIQLEVLGSYEANGNLLIGTVNTNIKNHIRGVTTNEATNFPLKVTYTETGNTYIVDANGNVDKKKPVTIPQGLQIGSNVTYAPTGGTYKWAAEYCSSTKTIGNDDVNLYSTTSGTGTNMRQTSWNVFKIDADTGEVQLVPSAAIGSLYLGQAQGYNNAVQLLDGVCSALYSYSAKGITARSIDLEDIEPLLDEAKLQARKDICQSGDYLDENAQVKTAYTSYRNFPRIYEEEISSVINGDKKTTGLGLNTPGSKLYSRTEITSLNDQSTSVNASAGHFKAKTSIQPYDTHYTWQRALSTAENYKEYGTEYASILNKKFWIASRCVETTNAHTNIAYFCVFMNGGVGLDTMRLFSSTPSSPYDGSISIFPVVTLSSELIKKDGSSFKVDL